MTLSFIVHVTLAMLLASLCLSFIAIKGYNYYNLPS